MRLTTTIPTDNQTVMKHLVYLLLLCLITGCASVGTKMDMSRAEQIERGVTTRSDLIAMFGQPRSVGFDANQSRTATWIYSSASNRATNFIPVVGLVSSTVDTYVQTLTVIFDENDVVKDFTYNESNSEVKTGLVK